MKYTLYIIKNTINDKVYIGQTTKTAIERFKSHIKKSKRNIYKIHLAIAKYGKENFYVETICQCSNSENIDYLEKTYISEFNSIENGYNIESGGCRQKSLTQETKDKISKKLMGHYQAPQSEEAKRKIGDAHKGLKPFAGKSHSGETKKRMSEAAKKRWNK